MCEVQAARRTPLSLLLIVAGIAVPGAILDQVTKHLAVTRLDPNHPVALLGGMLSLRLLRNPGAAFSMGTSATVGLSVLAIVAFFGVVLVAVPRLQRRSSAVAAGMALAGIVGNLTDRLFREPGPMRGHVIDFFSVPHFAVFNVADIFITSTAILLLGQAFLGREPDATEEDQ